MPRRPAHKPYQLKDGQRVRIKLLTETTHLGTVQRSAEDIIVCCGVCRKCGRECKLAHRLRFTIKGDVLTWRAYRLEEGK